MLDAGGIAGKLGLDLSDYAKGILQADSIAAMFPSVVKSFLADPLLGLVDIAKTAAGAIKNAFLEIAQGAHDVGVMSEKTGASVSFLSSVGRLAKDAGSDMAGLGDAFKHLEKSAADAAGGDKTAQEAFARLGISAGEVQDGMTNVEGLFWRVGDAIKALPSPAEKTQAAMALLSRSGAEMIPLFNRGSEEAKRMAGVFEQLGAVSSKEGVATFEAWDEVENMVEAAWTGIKKAVAMPIANFIKEHFEEIKAFIIDAAGMIRKVLGPVMEFIMSAFEALWPAILAAWDMFKALAEVVMDMLAPAFEILKPILQVIGATLKIVIDAVTWLLKLLAEMVKYSPIGMIGSALKGAGKIGGESGGPAAGGGGAGGGVNIQNLNVGGMDAEKASSQIATKIRPPLQQALRQRDQVFEGSRMAEKIAKGL